MTTYRNDLARLKNYDESQLLRQWKGCTVLARMVDALDRNLTSGDRRFLDRLSAWVEAGQEAARPDDRRPAAS